MLGGNQRSNLPFNLMVEDGIILPGRGQWLPAAKSKTSFFWRALAERGFYLTAGRYSDSRAPLVQFHVRIGRLRRRFEGLDEFTPFTFGRILLHRKVQ